MFRFLCMVCVMSVSSLANGQGFADVFAWNACKQARTLNHSISVKPSQDAAIAAVGKAKAAYAAVPGKYQSQFKYRHDALSTALASASSDHANGDGYRAVADGVYSVIQARVAANNWAGVSDAANQCTSAYNRSTAYLNAAKTGYGGAGGAARSLEYDINRFLSMLRAFEDFYGPSP